MSTTLDDDLGTLQELDYYRTLAKKLMHKGVKGLCDADNEQWNNDWDSDNTISNALVVRSHALALQIDPSDDSCSGDTSRTYIQRVIHTENDVLARPQEDLPVYKAARILHALIRSQGHILSKISVLSLYRVLREFYDVQPPEMNTGGTRAGEGARATSFMTLQCVLAVKGFCDAINNTIQLLDKIAHIVSIRKMIESNRIAKPNAWKELVNDYMEMNLTIEFQDLTGREFFGPQINITKDNVWKYVESFPGDFAIFLKDGINEIDKALQEIDERRVEEAQQYSENPIRWHAKIPFENASHEISKNAIFHCRKRLEVLCTALCGTPAWDSVNWHNAVQELQSCHDKFKELIRPSKRYFSNAMNRFLSFQDEHAFQSDIAELVFSAVGYGCVKEKWDSKRIVDAIYRALEFISPKGKLPSGHPFSMGQKGWLLHIICPQVFHYLAIAIKEFNPPNPREHLDLDRLKEAVKRMICWFDDNKFIFDNTDNIGWTMDTPTEPKKPERWVSVWCTLALNKIVALLDKVINQCVYKHVDVKSPEELDVELHQMIVSDFGLRQKKSVAFMLADMQNHLLGHQPLVSERPIFSAVLHGPPGTGKTTIAEALAKTARAQFVQITPSDIVVGGAEQAERSARNLFQALCMLTNTVILFDEFDPILWHRDPDGKVPTTVFEYLTPGMLPKLKDLYRAAKRQRNVYMLATNNMRALDDAATRKGRFDEKLGIYPPDLLSRVGQLALACEKHAEESNTSSASGWEKRFARVIQKTAGGPMDTLGKPGWFTPPDSSIKPDTIFDYLWKDGPEPDWPDSEATMQEKLEKKDCNTKSMKQAYLEQEEWQWVIDWDRRAGEGWQQMVEALRHPLQKPNVGWDV
ncbi:MAG: AAA family ATPase [Deltaproteobacteria bacterium]|nr:AAA family ATPase [Deltaproteobacteria bacterium]